MAYGYHRAITINSLYFTAGTQTNFAVCINGTYAYLAGTGSGGNVTSASGFDIIFTSDAAGLTQLNHEIEAYNTSTGVVVFWVRIPTISSSSNTVIYMWYGNAAVTTSQENIVNVWDAYYTGVWHLTSTAKNSVTGVNGTVTGTTTPAGQIGLGKGFTSLGSDRVSTDISGHVNLKSWSFWEKWGGIAIGASAPRLFSKGTTTVTEYCFNNGSATFVFGRTWSGANATWSFPVPADANWHLIVITYDSSSSANAPVVYVDGSSVTVTTTTAASGTRTDNAEVFVIGNRGTTNDRAWDGSLDEVRETSGLIRDAAWVSAQWNTQNSNVYYTISTDASSPTVSITSPAASATVTGSTVSITATAADDVAVLGVQFQLDGVNLGAEDTVSAYAITWDTTGTTNGSHTLTAIARDGAGNYTTSAAIVVTVSNGVVVTTLPSGMDGVNPAVVVLTELSLLEKVGAWTASGGSSFYCTFLTYAVPEVVRGGLYRRLDRVILEATSLTVRASSALVDSNLGSYFLDTATNRLYVSTPSGLTPDTYSFIAAGFTVFFATTTISFTDQPLYEPRLSGSLPAFSTELPDPVFGSTQAATGELTLDNTDKLFDKLIKRWIWRNKKVTFKIGAAGITYANFTTIGTLRINNVQLDDNEIKVQLEDIGTILNQTVPTNTWGDGSAVEPTIIGSFAKGKVKPWLFGTVEKCPLTLVDTTTNYGVYRTLDPILYPAGIFLTAVYAVSKTTGNTIVLINSDWTSSVDNAWVQILNATYNFNDYEILADLSEFGGNRTCGGFVTKLLTMLGVAAADIDATSMAAADVENPAPLNLYLNAATPAIEIIHRIEQSVLGQTYRTLEGKWAFRIFDANPPSTALSFADEDFVVWAAEDRFVGILEKVQVQFEYRPSFGVASQSTVTNLPVLYGSETLDSISLPTYLAWEVSAMSLAGHLAFLKAEPPAYITFTARDLRFLTSLVGDLVYVTRNRAPQNRTGAYDAQVLRIIRLEKVLNDSDGPSVRGVLDDIQGQTDSFFRLAPSGSTLTWATATAAERSFYGFLADTNLYIDPLDPLTKNLKNLS